jgi:hypothetical protein
MHGNEDRQSNSGVCVCCGRGFALPVSEVGTVDRDKEYSGDKSGQPGGKKRGDMAPHRVPNNHHLGI